MSSVKYEWEAVEGVGEDESFGDWVVNNFIWSGQSLLTPLPDVGRANELEPDEKQALYDFINAGKKADEEMDIVFPDDNELAMRVLGQDNEGVIPLVDMEKAHGEGLAAGKNAESTLLDNPYVRFNQPLWRQWRLGFIKARKETEAAPEPETTEPAAEPGLTLLQRRMLEIDAELIALNPKVRTAQNLVDSLKEDLKEAKGDLDSLLEDQADLCNKLSVISEGGSYQPNLPFDSPHPDVEDGKNRSHGTPLLNAAAKALREDPGKKTSVHDLDITEKQADALVDQSIYMITDLEERIRNASMGGYPWFDGVAGIAKGKATAVEDALEAWRRENPVPCADDDDEPEEIEAEAAEEEPDTIPMGLVDPQWWCAECNHEWPVDGENDVCPACENETGNYQFGMHDCNDANALGVIFRNYEEVQIIDDDKVKCIVQVYQLWEGEWISCIEIIDEFTPYQYSNTMNIEDYTSTSRDAAISNQLSHYLENCEDVDGCVAKAIGEYIDLHLSKIDGDYLNCVGCDSGYAFDKSCPEKPHCPFCGTVEHTPAD